jgi:hypothetical protein
MCNLIETSFDLKLTVFFKFVTKSISSSAQHATLHKYFSHLSLVI